MGIESEISQGARETEEKTELSDHGMPLDSDDIPANADEAKRQGAANTSTPHED